MIPAPTGIQRFGFYLLWLAAPHRIERDLDRDGQHLRTPLGQLDRARDWTPSTEARDATLHPILATPRPAPDRTPAGEGPPVPPRRRRAGRALAVAAAVTLLLGCAPPGQRLPALPTGTPAPPIPTVPPDGEQRLRALAGTITALPGDTTSPTTHPYSYIRVQRWARATRQVARLDETRWRAADGTGRIDTRRLPHRADLTRLPDPAERRQLAAAPATVDHYPQPRRLAGIIAEPVPETPAALAAALHRHQPAATGAQALLWAYADLASLHYLNQPARAAALQVLAGIPGLTYDGIARDIAGRTGLAFALDSGAQRDTILLDPRTGRLLARSQTLTTTPPALVDHLLYLDTARVSTPGEGITAPTPARATKHGANR